MNVISESTVVRKTVSNLLDVMTSAMKKVPLVKWCIQRTYKSSYKLKFSESTFFFQGNGIFKLYIIGQNTTFLKKKVNFESVE